MRSVGTVQSVHSVVVVMVLYATGEICCATTDFVDRSTPKWLYWLVTGLPNMRHAARAVSLGIT
ncbi:hypothetical protein MB901379_00480 [Mycobacterium basiliense]|uniref:Uncharacterized protein n=1 Tax=Mycobacterium basiliense TaxID=2094119 RepID=A0A447G978_9MYCO|nr:hypothetical protein MB901379_00480 [Mycobacterium basiliense]